MVIDVVGISSPCVGTGGVCRDVSQVSSRGGRGEYRGANIVLNGEATCTLPRVAHEPSSGLSNGIGRAVQKLLRDGNGEEFPVLVNVEDAPRFMPRTVPDFRTEDVSQFANLVFLLANDVRGTILIIKGIRTDYFFGTLVGGFAVRYAAGGFLFGRKFGLIVELDVLPVYREL